MKKLNKRFVLYRVLSYISALMLVACAQTPPIVINQCPQEKITVTKAEEACLSDETIRQIVIQSDTVAANQSSVK